MLDSRITKKKKRKKKKMEKKVKTLRILTSWFEIRGKEEKCMGWCKNYGNSCTVWSEAVEIFKKDPKRTRFANFTFCGRLERRDIRGNSLFRFSDRIFHPCVSYGSNVDLWWIMMYVAISYLGCWLLVL